MYLHLGQDYIVPLQSVVAVFDMDTATVSKRTQALLARLQEEGRIIELYEDLPRAAVLCENALGETLYLTQLSPAGAAEKGGKERDWIETRNGKWRIAARTFAMIHSLFFLINYEEWNTENKAWRVKI